MDIRYNVWWWCQCYDLIKEIRKKDANAPVIFTSARDQELDKILGLELERDDYITKPYSS